MGEHTDTSAYSAMTPAMLCRRGTRSKRRNTDGSSSRSCCVGSRNNKSSSSTSSSNSSSNSSNNSSSSNIYILVLVALLHLVRGSTDLGSAPPTPRRVFPRPPLCDIAAISPPTGKVLAVHEAETLHAGQERSPTTSSRTATTTAAVASASIAFALPDDLHKRFPKIPHIGRPAFLDDDGGVGSIVRDFKMALAGALAGAVATAALFPIDTAKTLRQANPRAFRGTREALAHICRTRGPLSVYTGIPTAVLGAMPSSALYFGTYEAVKTRLMRVAAEKFPVSNASAGCIFGERGDEAGQWELEEEGGEGGGGSGVAGGRRRRGGRGRRRRGGGGEGGGGGGVHPVARAGAHAMAAACGNAASSLIFVPKEYVKQTLQASGMGAVGSARETAREIVARTVREKGVRGLYCGYWATLSRNVPSAIIRFTLYEEIKLFMGPARLASAPPAYLLAGALAGACASGLTTPFDVLKTRVATGSLDGGRGFAANMAAIVAEDGWKGLYAGFQPRVVMSALFTAVGFGSFETLKTALGVSPLPPPAVSAKSRALQGDSRRRGGRSSGSSGGSSSSGDSKSNSGSSSNSGRRNEKLRKAALSRS